MTSQRVDVQYWDGSAYQTAATMIRSAPKSSVMCRLWRARPNDAGLANPRRLGNNSHPMKIAHLTSVHPPTDVRIFHKECLTLASNGYEVVLIVPHAQSETRGEVRIHAIRKRPGRVGRLFGTTLAVLRAALGQKADVYHFHDPELIPVGMLLKLAGKRVVYDVHEDVPAQILTKPYLSPIVRWPLAQIARSVEFVGSQLFFDRVITATPTIQANFPSRKTVSVQNFPRLEELGTDAGPAYSEREPLIAYVGGVSTVRGIGEMVDAIALLPGELGAKLAIAGPFESAELEGSIRERADPVRVDLLGWQGREHMRQLLMRAKLGIVTLHPVPNYLPSLPTKLFEYMAYGLPVVASDFPLWREIVEEAECGLLVDPMKPGSIADGIRYLLEHPEEAERMGQSGQRMVRKKYSWAAESVKLLGVYGSILGPRSGNA